ncbi:MAG: DUF4215 domain-containing protein, partial [Candidatus Binatia bacterium]
PHTCQFAGCGDGVVQAGVEQCDDGNTTSGDGCSATCQLEGPPDTGSCTDATPTSGCTVNGIAAQLCLGTPGNDTISGTAGADVIAGKGGNDFIEGKGGQDRLCGEAGDDVLRGNEGNDTLDGGVGKDKLLGDEGTDTCLKGETVKKCEL